MRVRSLALAIALLSRPALAAEAPCPALLPAAPRAPATLGAFLEGLGRAVSARDGAALTRAAAPDIRLDLGDSRPLAALRLEDAASPAWPRLRKALSPGCRPAGEGAWECPGLAGLGSDARDADPDPDRVFILARRVALRTAPAPDSPVIARLSCRVVTFDHDGRAALPGGPEDESWVPVRLGDGRRGFVAGDFAHLAIGYRLLIEQRPEGWRITAFLAGD